MKRRITISAALVLILIAVLVTFLITNSIVSEQFQKKLQELDREQLEFQKLSTVDAIIREHYAKSVDETVLSEGSIGGYIAALKDPYCRYLSAEEYVEYLKTSEEKTVYSLGIQVGFDEKNGVLRVYHVESASPAATAGIVAGDVISAINDITVTDNGLEKVNALLSGPEGAEAVVHIASGEETVSYPLVYSKIESDSVSGTLALGQAGWIHIYRFDSYTAAQLKTTIDTLIEKGADSLIFDLRDVKGRSFDDAVVCADVIAGLGDLARVMTTNETITVLTGEGASIPMDCAVLVDSNTEGDAELFAAILRDVASAKIVGANSAGVCGLQADIKLNDQSAIILTTKVYLPPVSDSFENAGLKPDLEMEELKNFRALTAEDDVVFSEAYYLLKPNKRPSGDVVIPDLPDDGTEDPPLIEPGM